MPGLFGDLTLAAKALQTNQVAIQVTGRNIANVNNPEYARQRVFMGDKFSYSTPTGPEGTGVEVLAVQQIRDALLDKQVIRQASETESLNAQQSALSDAELALGDKIDAASTPTSVTDTSSSTSGVGGALDDFFSAASALSASPSDIPTREAAIEAAKILADRVNNADGRLAILQGDSETQIQSDLKKANGLLGDIARLNGEIRGADSLQSGNAADLVDQRQKAMEDLAGIIKFDMSNPQDAPNMVDISIGGQLLVTYGLLPKGANPLGYTPSSPKSNGVYPQKSVTGYTAGQITVGNIDVTSSVTGGGVYGRYTVAAGAMATLRDQLKTFSDQLTTAVNAKYTPASGGTFFSTAPSNGNLLEVSSALNSTTLATGKDADPTVATTVGYVGTNTNTKAGDNSFIQAISNLRNSIFSTVAAQGVVVPGTADKLTGKLVDYVRGTVTTLAGSLHSVATRSNEAGVIDKAIRAQRDSVSGVSLDEETTNMMQYQRAYQANAKVISVLDSMLDSVINSMIR